MIFIKFTELWNDHHYPVLEHFHCTNMSPDAHLLPLPTPTPNPRQRKATISTDPPILDISYVTSASGFFHLP